MADLRPFVVQFLEIGFGGAFVMGLFAHNWPSPLDSRKKKPELVEVPIVPTLEIDADAGESTQSEQRPDTSTGIQQVVDYITTTQTETETEYVPQHITVDRTVTQEAATVTVDRTLTSTKTSVHTSTESLAPQTIIPEGSGLIGTTAHTSQWSFGLTLLSVGLVLGLILSLGLRAAYQALLDSKREPDEDDSAIDKGDLSCGPKQQRADCHGKEIGGYWAEMRAYNEKRSQANQDHLTTVLDTLQPILDTADHCLSRKEIANALARALCGRAAENHRRALALSCPSDDHTRALARFKEVARLDRAEFADENLSNVSQMLLREKGPWVDNVVLRDRLNKLEENAASLEEYAPHVHATCPEHLRNPGVRPQRFTRSPDRVRSSARKETPAKVSDATRATIEAGFNASSFSTQSEVSKLQPDASSSIIAEPEPALAGGYRGLRVVVAKTTIDDVWSMHNFQTMQEIGKKHGTDIDAAAREIQQLYDDHLQEEARALKSVASTKSESDSPFATIPDIQIDEVGTAPDSAESEESQESSEAIAADTPLPKSPEIIPDDYSSSPDGPSTQDFSSPSPAPRSTSRRPSKDASHEPLREDRGAEQETATELHTLASDREFIEALGDSNLAGTTEHNPVVADDDEGLEDATHALIESTTEEVAQEDSEVPAPAISDPITEYVAEEQDIDADALTSRCADATPQAGLRTAPGGEAEDASPALEDVGSLNPVLNEVVDPGLATEPSSAIVEEHHSSDADADRKLKTLLDAPEPELEDSDASLVQGENETTTQHNMVTEPVETNMWIPETGFIGNSNMSAQMSYPQQQPSAMPSIFGFQTTPYQFAPSFAETSDGWTSFINNQQYGFPPSQGPFESLNEQLPDEDSAMDGFEATGIALSMPAPPPPPSSPPPPSPPPPPPPPLFTAPQAPPQEPSTEDSLDEDTDLEFEDVRMPNGQTIEFFQNATAPPPALGGAVDASIRSEDAFETEMLDGLDARPPTPSDGRDASRDGVVQGWWNYNDGITSTSTREPVDGTQLPNGGSASSPSTIRGFSIDTQLANGHDGGSSEFPYEAAQESEVSPPLFSPLFEDNSPGSEHNNKENSQDDASQRGWYDDKDYFVPSPPRQSPSSLSDDDDPFATTADASNEPSTAAPPPPPSVQPDYSAPPPHSTSGHYANPTSTSVGDSFFVPPPQISLSAPPYTPLAVQPPTPAQIAAQRAAVVTARMSESGSDSGGDSESDAGERTDEQRKAATAAMMARMDAQAAVAATPQPLRERFSLLEMTGRLHGFVGANRRRLQGVRRRAGELEGENDSDDNNVSGSGRGGGPKEGEEKKKWRAAIGEVAQTLVQRVEDAEEVNGSLIEEWEALDVEAAKGWSWEGIEGRRRAIARSVACVEMMLRLLQLLAKEVGGEAWRERVHGAIVDEEGSAISCARWWEEIGAVGVAPEEGLSKKVDAMQEGLEELFVELCAEQRALQIEADRREDEEADEKMRRLLGDDDDSDLSDPDEDIIANGP